MPQRQNMLQFRTLDRAQVGYRSMRLLTSFEVSIAGKELSKPSICWPPTLAWLKSPPSRSSSPSSTVASLSFSEANWSASSPRRARSRERKSSVSFESPTRSKSVDGPRACVWPGNVQYALRSCFGGSNSWLTGVDLVKGGESVRHLEHEMCEACAGERKVGGQQLVASKLRVVALSGCGLAVTNRRCQAGGATFRRRALSVASSPHL
jgi:hypothetical protein